MLAAPGCLMTLREQARCPEVLGVLGRLAVGICDGSSQAFVLRVVATGAWPALWLATAAWGNPSALLFPDSGRFS